MSATVPVLKDESGQHPIPAAWRSTLVNVVEALKDGDPGLVSRIPGVRPIPAQVASDIMANIQAYGAQLISLPEESWKTSACRWMRGYWDVLVDLYTAEEGASDLALAVRVYEEGSTYGFEVQSVHVP